RPLKRAKGPAVLKAIVQVTEDGTAHDVVYTSAPSTHVASTQLARLVNHPQDQGDDWAAYDDDGQYSIGGVTAAAPAASDVRFYQSHLLPGTSRHSQASYRVQQQRCFDDWTDLVDDVVVPFLSAMSRASGPESGSYDIRAWDRLLCPCLPDLAIKVTIVDFSSRRSHPIRSCTEHLAATLIGASAFPSTACRPTVAFSFRILQFFLALQERCRIGAFGFAGAFSELLRIETGEELPIVAISSRDSKRRPLRLASEWFQALEQQCANRALGREVKYALGRPFLDHDDLVITLDDLAMRCPACFGGLARNHVPVGAPQVIVCLDGNFQHKRHKAQDALRQSPRRPTSFISRQQLEATRKVFENPNVGEGPRTGCSADVKAAIDGFVKTSRAQFDIGGVVGMTCRHGSPLILVNVHDTGEKHYYAYALLTQLLDACGTALDHLGVCYDIGCKLSVSPRLAAALARRSHPVLLTHVVSVFHSYGHDFDCQLKFSPRRTPGFGLTDGEALERLWSSLADLVSITRDMSEADRLSTLSARLHKLARSHRLDLMATCQRRLRKIASSREQGIKEFMAPVPHLVQYTGERVADAYASSCPTTGLPLRISELLQELVALRRKKAFDKAGVIREISRTRARNTRRRVIDLSLEAKALILPLKSYHSLTAVLNRRLHTNSQDATARLAVSLSGSATQAKSARLKFNDAARAYRGATDPQYRTRIFTISEEALFRLSTLTYVSGLASPADIEDEPWVTDSDLFGAMDTVDLFTRLDEEHERIRLELDNMLIWYKEVEYELHARIEVEPSGLSGPEMANQAQFVGRLLSEHRSTLAHWAARSLKIAG
ncbi:hypothetical protein CF336_g8875, partial [Tilletia laevis]